MGWSRTAVGALTVALVLVATPGPAAAGAAVTGERASAQAPAVVPGLRADWRERMLARLNAIRADAGAPPVRLCGALDRSAEDYARHMARANRMSHTGADGSTALQRVARAGYRADLVGENLGAGQPTVADVTGDWRRSATHYATMTDPRFRHVGFGYTPDRTGPYVTYWVQHFGVGGSC